jgi:hypothetical protein
MTGKLKRSNIPLSSSKTSRAGNLELGEEVWVEEFLPKGEETLKEGSMHIL